MSNFVRPIGPITTGRPARAVQNTPGTGREISFQEIFNRKLAEASASDAQRLTFSRHAQERTRQRGVELTQDDYKRLDAAVDKAQAKGLGDTLVFMNNTAFIVNVPNRVVVTVLDADHAQNTVFTNIDGAVIV